MKILGKLHVPLETAKVVAILIKKTIMLLNFYFIFLEKSNDFTRVILMYLIWLLIALPMIF